MKALSLKITDTDYLIRLRKEDFDIHFIYQMLRNMQSDHLDLPMGLPENQDDILSISYSREESIRFDKLCDK